MVKNRSVGQTPGVEQLPGVVRRTLAYNGDVMLCHFELKKGAEIPLHSHVPSQIGYVVSGRVRFIGDTEADGFEAGPGQAYAMDPQARHGAVALEPSVLIEVFNPPRPEYQDF